MSVGKIIVIDGLDGCGKSTQTQLAYEYLLKQNIKAKLISYPDYSKPSSTLVKMYLNGDFSQNPSDVNAYAASTFYAIDRYASYMQYWKELYNKGYTIIASRYTTSNAIHQMSKLPQSQWDYYLDWLDDYEYNKLGLPPPDKVIFLDMPRDIADKLILNRYLGDDSKKDIHENDIAYLKSCQKSAHYVGQKQNWALINCTKNSELLSVEDIRNLVLNQIIEVINK